jgi:tetratricopeptide (TPR) repeat protein
MKRLILAAVMLAGLIGCAGKTMLPDDQLRSYTAKKILEIAAEKYVAYDYESAIYYYNKIIEIYPEDVESVSWAYYEIGFIFFVKHKYQMANDYFGQGSPDETLTHASSFRANMKRVSAER